ncbi:MAG: S-layer homology domain-containing protein [Clostridia bacterium]|nr:S-layer homology domain-containing protein [Clostridia bacterium]
MKFAKHIMLIFALALTLSYAPCLTHAQTDMLSVDPDIKNSTVSITYTDRLHSYAQFAVAITNNDDNSIVYLNQLTSDEGFIELNDIPVKSDGTYTVAVSAIHGSVTVYDEFDFYSIETLEQLWTVATAQRGWEEVKAQWETIEAAFNLDIENFTYLDDFDLFFQRLSGSRDDYDLTDGYKEDLGEFSDICEEIALFAALHSHTDTDTISVLVSKAMEYIREVDNDFYVEFSKIIGSEDYDGVILCFAADKTEVKDVDSLIDSLKAAIEKNDITKVLSSISKVEHIDEIISILTNDKNAKLLGIEEYVDEYKALQSKTLVNNALFSGELKTLDDFKKIFKEAIDKAKTPDDDSTNQDTNSPGKHTSSGLSSSSAPTASVRVPEAEGEHKFIDLENHLWAKDSITELYNKGIVSGKSEGIFAPSDYITREEFVKMAVLSFGISASSADNGFSDVDANSWYCPFVSGAKNAGLVSGVGNGMFGVGKNITRQDIAVILANYLSVNGVDTASDMTVITATDFDNTASYAKEAVTFLINNGIINGNESGLICPNDYATRAEISVLLVRFNNKFVKMEG